MKDIKIDSSLLNSDEFKFVKDSLIKASEADGQANYRVKTLEYINDSCENENDMFFYDMLEFVRFMNPADTASAGHIAYTTPDKLIYFNMPNSHIANARQWDFTHDHECLHQLWDTFKVADKIQSDGIEYNHQILNIASDCVINQYLRDIRHKECAPGLITPELLKSEFGVDYDFKTDTQYTLYMKLLDVYKEQKQQLEDFMSKHPESQDDENSQSSSEQRGDGSSSGSSSSGSSSNSQQSDSQSGSKSDETADEAAKRAQKAADKAKEAARKSGSKEDAKAAEEAQKAADKAKEAAEEANDASSQGDKDKASKEAEKAADKAEDATGGSKEAGNSKGDDNQSKEDLDKIRKQATSIIEKYRSKITGDFGKFISKCKSSMTLNPSGLKVETQSKGVAGWATKMKSYINAFVKKKVFQKKREFEPTYKRMNKRQGVVHAGDVIKKGKRVKKNGLTINAAFYIDRSGSMAGEPIKNVFTAAYAICESLKKQFKSDKVVDEISFKMHAFDESMHSINFGNTMSANGGTMAFHKILDYISKNTKDFMINVIITDAQFDINESEVKNLIKNIDGMILFVTNTPEDTMKKLSKEFGAQLFYILADQEFKL